MKIILSIVVTLTVLFSASPLVVAQSSDSYSTKTPNPGQIKNLERIRNTATEEAMEKEKLRAEVKEKIQERVASKEARLSQLRKEKIKKFFNQMLRRFEVAISRLEKLTLRIQTRIDKIKASGQDTTSLQEELNGAKGGLEDTKNKLNDAKAKLDTVLSSENPKDAFKEVHDMVKDVRNDLTKVHKTLVHLIGRIIGLRVGQGKTGTPGPTSTATPSASLTPAPSTTPTTTPTATP